MTLFIITQPNIIIKHKTRWKYLYEVFISMDTIELEKTRIKGGKVSHEKNKGPRYRKMFVSGIVESDSHAWIL